jgi:hypothetical protein
MILTLSASPVTELSPLAVAVAQLPTWPTSVAVLTAAATTSVVTSTESTS